MSAKIAPSQPRILIQQRQETSRGPTGSVQVGKDRFTVNNGDVFLNGKRVGTLKDNGDYLLIGADGKNLGGNLGTVPGAVFSGTLSTGASVSNRPTARISVGRDTFEVNEGSVFRQGQLVGSLNDCGEFDVTLDGQHNVGRLEQLPGAAIAGVRGDGTAVDNRPSGKLRLGTETAEVLFGDVYFHGQRVGSLNDTGDYRVVLQGQELVGNLAKTPGVVFAGVTSDQRAVGNLPTGTVDVNGEHYRVLAGAVYRDATLVGSLNDAGEYRVLDRQGVLQSGTLTELPDAQWEGQLFSGARVRRSIIG